MSTPFGAGAAVEATAVITAAGAEHFHPPLEHGLVGTAIAVGAVQLVWVAVQAIELVTVLLGSDAARALEVDHHPLRRRGVVRAGAHTDELEALVNRAAH